MKRGSSALLTLALLLLFCASTLASGALRDRPPRPPKPPSVKGKGIGKLGKGILKSRRGRGGRKNSRSKSRKQAEKKKKEEENRYHVVQIGLKFEVVQKKNFGSVKKGAPKKYKAQVSEYKKGRDEAKKAGEKFKGPKPPGTIFKVLTRKGYKKQKDAKADADKLQRQVDSKRKK